MQRTRLFIAVAINLLLLAHTTLAQFQQLSFLPKVDDPEPVYSIVLAGSTNRVAFAYKQALYTADGTPTGTKKYADMAYENALTNGPMGYVYFSDGSGWKYFNPATNKITVISASAGDWGYPLPFNSTVKTFGIWRTSSNYQIESFNPSTNTVKVESTLAIDPDPFPIDAALYKNKVVTRYTLKPPGVSSNPYDLATFPSNIYYAPYINAVFFAYAQPNAGTGVELWRTDLKNYTLVADINPGSGNSNPRSFCDVPGVGLFFFANPEGNLGQVSLFWTDGVSSVKRLHDYTMIPPTFIPVAQAGRHVVFIITNGEGLHLWSSDGTVEGTIDLMRINDNQLASNGDWGFFVSYSDQYGLELYQTDGTVAGTGRVPYETVPGSGDSYPSGLTAIGRDLFFNSHTPDGQIQVFKYTPPRSTIPPLVLYDPKRQWIPGGHQYNWGGVGSCTNVTKKAPSNQPLSNDATPGNLTSQSTVRIHVKDRYYGCGEFYSSFIDLSGAKEVRFWIQSTAKANVGLKVNKPCAPYVPVSGQDACKVVMQVPSTGGVWKSVGIPLNDRPLDEFAETYSPFQITVLEAGDVSISNIIAVY